MRRNIKRFTPAEKVELKEFLEHWEAFSGSFFWTPPSNAGCRRSYEARNSRELEFNFRGTEYKMFLDVECSCKNVYTTKGVLVDGKKRTIKAIKKLMIENKMEV